MKIRCPADDGTSAHVALDLRLPVRVKGRGGVLDVIGRLRCPCGKALVIDTRPETPCVGGAA